MKKFLLAAFCAALISGCGSSTPGTTEATVANVVTPAPPGLIAAKDASPLPEGTMIYSDKGEVIGIIRKYDTKHEFPDKKIESGVLLEKSPGVEEWVAISVVENAFLAKQ